MAAYMFDLPGVPEFPVYGLDNRFKGKRWLVLWNGHARLFTVTLGHGPVEADQFIAVTAVFKSPLGSFDTADAFGQCRPATGFEDAFTHVVTNLDDGSPWTLDQLNLVEWNPGARRDLHIASDLGGTPPRFESQVTHMRQRGFSERTAARGWSTCQPSPCPSSDLSG